MQAKPQSRRPRAALGRALLDWYDRNARALPWRAPPGVRPDPYRVWLSEIMLQQTTVAAAGPYFLRFVSLWPDVFALAAASREDVLREWAGLGYYSRARNLHACALAVVAAHGGAFPADPEALRALPGIGPYTAGAIAAIAFGRRALAVDGNVERVASRLAAIGTPLPAAKAEIRDVAASLMPRARPGDFAQALMDLGATTCTPRAPSCGRCPLARGCAAHASGREEAFPVKPPRRARPLRRGVAFVLRDDGGAIWLTRRAEKGLLGGMMQVPTTEWVEGEPSEAMRAAARPAPGPWRRLGGTVRHVFTHFELELELEVAVARAAPCGEGRWCAPEALARAGLPSVFRKVAAAAGVAPAAGRRR